MKDLFLWTFNCAKLAVRQNELTQLISQKFNNEQIAVFAFQEVCPIIDACLASQHDYARIIESSIIDAIGREYKHVGTVSMGAVLLVVYTNNPVDSVKTAAVKNGYLRSSLKGAAGMRMMFENEEFTFVAAHLSAGEGKALARNQDYYNLVTRLDFNDGYGAYKPDSHLFFLGDFNYRARNDGLLEGDELTKEIQKGAVFHGIDEAKIEFPPTYKFNVGTNSYDKHRIPSWCDRILFKKYDNYQVHGYNSINATCSDHLPVYLSISVDKPNECVGRNGYLVDSDINLGLDPKRVYYQSYGDLSDYCIGWGLFLSMTKNGRVCLFIGCAMLYLLYLLV